MLENIKVNVKNCYAAASDPALLATDLADYLVRKGVPFRQAHHAVGSLVAVAERNGRKLNQLSLGELRSIDSKFGNDALEVFNIERALARRKMTGAPSPREVKKQLAKWKRVLGK